MIISRVGWWRWAVLAAVLAAVSLLAGGTVVAGGTGRDLTEEAQECFECHEDESLEKDLTNGETLSLNVDSGLFMGSAHVSVECTGCHQDIILDDHPEERDIESRQAYQKELSQSCGNCHSANPLQEGPPHYALVSGMDVPACVSCHDVHAMPNIDEWKSSLDETSYCLSCHGPAIRANLGNGSSNPPVMDEAQLRASVHLDHDCTDCHLDFGKDLHAAGDFAGRREDPATLAGVCRECHEEMYEQYEGSIHYSLLAQGNPDVPVCVDCHGSHLVNPVATLETIAGVPCRRCHQEIFDSYAGSMHGQARAAAGHMDAPICADCHQAHGVRAGDWTERFKRACMSCHNGLEDAHGAWLPNAGLHLDAVACPACHAPEAERRIDLVLFDRGRKRPVTIDDIRSGLGDAGGGTAADLSSADLWRYIRESKRGERGESIVLAGQLEVRTGVEAHRMTSKSSAVRTCPSCHLKGSKSFEVVTMSLVESDGRVRHIPVDNKALGSVTSMGDLANFYALGSTRIEILDLLLIMAVLGGMSVPAMHMTARLLARQKMGREER